MKANVVGVIVFCMIAVCAGAFAGQPQAPLPPFDFDAAERLADQQLKRPVTPAEKPPAIAATSKPASGCSNCKGTLEALCPMHKDQAAVVVEGRTPEQNCKYCSGLGRLACPTCKTNKQTLTQWEAVDKEANLALEAERATIEAINKDELPDVLNVKLTGYVCPHFSIASTLDSKLVLPCVHHGETLISLLRTTFPARDFDFPTHQDTRLYLLDTTAQYEKFVNTIWKTRYPSSDIAMALKAGGVHTYVLPSIGMTAFEREGKQADNLNHKSVHYLSHFLIDRVAGPRQYPTWIEEGFAAYGETLTLGSPKVYCMCYAENQIDIAKERDLAIAKMIKTNTTVAMDRLSQVTYISMRRDDYFQSWSMVTMLIARNPNKFIEFLRAVPAGRRDDSGLVVPSDEQETALKQTYGYDYPKLLAVWKLWAARR